MIKHVKDDSGRTHEIEIDDDFYYLSPYILAAKKLGVPVWRISRIIGYKVSLDKMERQQASITQESNKKVTISILKECQILRKKKGKIEAYDWDYADAGSNFENTLNSLAHEISHLGYWEHSADRFICETKLMVSFSRLAKKLGYMGY